MLARLHVSDDLAIDFERRRRAGCSVKGSAILLHIQATKMLALQEQHEQIAARRQAFVYAQEHVGWWTTFLHAIACPSDSEYNDTIHSTASRYMLTTGVPCLFTTA